MSAYIFTSWCWCDENDVFTWSTNGQNKLLLTLQTFFPAMTLYPEVQRTAQRELDVIVGAERLPEMNVCVCQCNSYGMSSMDFSCSRWGSALLPCWRWIQWKLHSERKHCSLHCSLCCESGSAHLSVSLGVILHGTSNVSNAAKPDVFHHKRFVKDGKLNPEVRHPDRSRHDLFWIREKLGQIFFLGRD